jgi:hypothetical protein
MKRRCGHARRFFLLFGLLIAFGAGCSALPQKKLPALDISAPGWEVRQGQALWKPGEDKPEIVGDVVLSVHPQAGSYVQFSKTLPILSARLAPEAWEFHAIAEDKRYSGGGKPPRKIVWLQMLRVLDGEEISERWSVVRSSNRLITLEDSFRGERLEVRFQ